MRVAAVFISNVLEELERDLENRALAQVRGLAIAARGLEKDLEAATEAAGLGRLSKAWASQVFPRKQGSLKATASIYVKGTRHTQDAMYAFTHGAIVRSKNGIYLAIPTENAPKVGMRGLGPGGKDKARDHLIAAAEARYGRLRFVYRRGKPSLLVADNVRAHTGARTGFARASKRSIAKGHTATIVVFFLVPVARLRKRFAIEPLEAKWRSQVVSLIEREYQLLSGR